MSEFTNVIMEILAGTLDVLMPGTND